MQRYFFHIRNGSGYVPDEEGIELPSPEKVADTAINGARSLLSAEVSAGELDLRGRIEVRDETGRRVLTVPFVEVVEIKTGPLPGSEPAEEQL